MGNYTHPAPPPVPPSPIASTCTMYSILYVYVGTYFYILMYEVEMITIIVFTLISFIVGALKLFNFMRFQNILKSFNFYNKTRLFVTLI